MYLYLALLLAIALVSILDFTDTERSKKFIVALPVFIFLAFDVAITVLAYDVATYRRIYDRMTEYPAEFRIDLFPEYGYQVLNYISRSELNWSFALFRGVYAFGVVCSIFFLTPLVNPRSLLFLTGSFPKYFLIGIISHMRSSMVYPFTFLVIYLVEKKKYLYTFLVTALLSQIHLSAILLNIAIPLRRIPLSGLLVLATLPVAIATQLLLPAIGADVSWVGIRQVRYFAQGDIERDSLISLEVLRRVFFLGLAFYLVAFKHIKDGVNGAIIKFFLLSVFIYVGFMDSKFISDRVGGMFGFVEPMLFVILIDAQERRSYKAVAAVAMYVYVFSEFFARFAFSTFQLAYDWPF